MKKSLFILNILVLSTFAIAETTLERNKANVLAFYDLAFTQHQPQKAVKQYIGTQYWQHNPHVADGGQAFIDAFTPFLQKYPQSRPHIKRVIAEGDFVVLHVNSKKTPDDLGNAVVDIFRLDQDGKIVEHWDISMPVPQKTTSGRSVF